MPLLDTGYQPNSYEDWLAKIQNDLRLQISNDIDLSSGSFYEQFAESISRQLADLDLANEDLYDSSFIGLAVGTALDRLGHNFGVTRNAAAYANTKIVITGEPGYQIEADTMFSNNEDRYFLTFETIVLDENGQGKVDVYAEQTGEDYNCDAHTITDQVMYVEEIETVDNPLPATGGADLETDYDFRRRIKVASNSAVSSTPNGVANGLYALPGVKSVSLTVNNTPSVNAAGDPPYTTHIYVLGGDRHEIAQCISDTVAAGITLTGDITENIKLENGDTNQIAFSLGTATPIYIKVSIDTDTATEDGLEIIKSEVQDVLESAIDDYSMGSTLKYTQLFGDIYDVDGVVNVTDLQWGTDANSLTRSDIVLSSKSVAETSGDNIEVTIND